MDQQLELTSVDPVADCHRLEIAVSIALHETNEERRLAAIERAHGYIESIRTALGIA